MSNYSRCPHFWWSPTWGLLQAPFDWTEDIWAQVMSAGPYTPVFIPLPDDARPLILTLPPRSCAA